MSDAPLRVGDVLEGPCEGVFGPEARGERRVEALGSDWVVARNEWGRPEFAWQPPETLVVHRRRFEDHSCKSNCFRQDGEWICSVCDQPCPAEYHPEVED